MKKNRIIFLLVAVLLVLAAIVFATFRYGTLNKSESEFAVADTAKVTRIFLADKQLNSVELKRVQDTWLVDNKYPAHGKMIDMLLGTLNKLEVKSPVSLASRDNVIRRMAGLGIKVEVYQLQYRINLFDKIKLFPHEKLSKVFYVGDATQNNLGTYMLMEGASDPYVVYIPNFRGFLFTRFSPKPDDWKSHVIFNDKLGDIKEVSVSFFEQTAESFQVLLSDAAGNYSIKSTFDNSPVESYDTLKVLNFLTSFRDLRYESRLNNILPPMFIDSVLQTVGIADILLVDNMNDSTYIRFFRKSELPESLANQPGVLVPSDADRAYALINGGEDFVLVQYYTFDKVLYPLSYYKK